jgi:cephalosporin hydroxylase
MQEIVREHPEIQISDIALQTAREVSERYGWLWQTEEGLAAFDFLRNNLPNGRGNGFIEVGSAHGASFAMWAHLFDGIKISVDMWDGDMENRKNLWTDQFENVYSIMGDSTSQESINQVSTLLRGTEIDFLFIDGNHDYEPTKSDYQSYGKFVRSGGFIGFHDINHHEHQEGCGKFWRELQGDKWETSWHWAGIGILRKP